MSWVSLHVLHALLLLQYSKVQVAKGRQSSSRAWHNHGRALGVLLSVQGPGQAEGRRPASRQAARPCADGLQQEGAYVGAHEGMEGRGRRYEAVLGYEPGCCVDDRAHLHPHIRHEPCLTGASIPNERTGLQRLS